PLDELIAHLRACAPASAMAGGIAQELEQVRVILAGLDAEGPGADTGRYRALARRLEPLPAPVDLARLVQVDLIKPSAGARLGAEIWSEIQRGIGILRRLEARGADDDLRRFREAFVRRYEGREV